MRLMDMHSMQSQDLDLLADLQIVRLIVHPKILLPLDTR